MAFPESIKLTIRHKAHFSCCICHAKGVEIHHIEAQADGGPDTEENGAPLCPSCHETYGANPTKKKFIRDARDHWYGICAARYASDLPHLEALHELLKNLPTKTDIGQMIASASLGNGYLPPSSEQDDHPDAELLKAAITADSLKLYLRWLYRSLRHCGPYYLNRLLTKILAAHYVIIGDLHSTLGQTKRVSAEFIDEKRDEGAEFDKAGDSTFAELFLSILDERYCRDNFPKAYASIGKRGSRFWFKALPKKSQSLEAE